MSKRDGGRVPVGKCPNCGYVTGDDLDYRFPEPSGCLQCGEELTNTTVADAETVQSLADDGLRADGGQVEDETGRKHCRECDHAPILFDPRPHPEPDRYLCPACEHEWRGDSSVDTEPEQDQTER